MAKYRIAMVIECDLDEDDESIEDAAERFTDDICNGVDCDYEWVDTWVSLDQAPVLTKLGKVE
jgi:hypothetical protein